MFYTLFYLNSLTAIGRPTHFRKRKDTWLGLLDQYGVVGLVLNQIMLLSAFRHGQLANTRIFVLLSETDQSTTTYKREKSFPYFKHFYFSKNTYHHFVEFHRRPTFVPLMPRGSTLMGIHSRIYNFVYCYQFIYVFGFLLQVVNKSQTVNKSDS